MRYINLHFTLLNFSAIVMLLIHLAYNNDDICTTGDFRKL